MRFPLPAPVLQLVAIIGHRPSPTAGLQAVLKRGGCTVNLSLGSMPRTTKMRIMRIFLTKRMEPVSSFLHARAIDIYYSAASQPMQTLQLNTRLSNESWVRQPNCRVGAPTDIAGQLGDDDDEDPFADVSSS